VNLMKKITGILLVGLLVAQESESGDEGFNYFGENSIVVTASRVEESLKNVTVRTEVIGEEVLQNRGVRSLAEAVQYSSGVRVETTCQNCNQQVIQLLGLPQQYIGILSDGLPNFSTLAGVYGVEQIPSGLIGQIEIVKGGGSVLYGPGAVAGVINLIPRDPTYTGGKVDLRIQNMRGDHFGEAPGGSAFGLYDFVSDDDKLKFTVYGGFDRVSPLDRDGDGFTEVSARDLKSGGVRTQWKPNDDHKVTFDLFISDEDRLGGAIEAFDGPVNLAAIAEEIFTTRYVATTKWEAQWGDAWDTRLAYSYAQTDRDSYYGGTAALGSPDPASPFFSATFSENAGFGETNDQLHLIDAVANWTPNINHQFTFAAQYSSESIVDEQQSAGRSIDETFIDTGLVVQHRYTPGDVWTFEYGSRVDFHSEVDNAIFSPRAAVLYSPNEDQRVRAAVSTGFRAPVVFNEDLHISNVGGELSTTFNDPNLGEESSVTISLSPEWFVKDRWRFEANFFHTWLEDTLVVEPNDDAATVNVLEFERTNGESSRVFGAEFNVGYVANNWRLELSWVEQRLRFEGDQLILGDETLANPNDNPIFSRNYVRTPESLGLIKFSQETKWFDYFVTGKLNGPMDVPHIVSDSSGNLLRNELVRTEWFFNVDVAGVQNLFDEFQEDLDQGAFRDSDFVYGPAFTRSFYTGLSYQF